MDEKPGTRRMSPWEFPEAPCQALPVPVLSWQPQHKYQAPLTYSHSTTAELTRHQVSTRRRQAYCTLCQQASFPLKGTSSLPFTWCGVWCWAEGTHRESFLLNQRLLRDRQPCLCPPAASLLPGCLPRQRQFSRQDGVRAEGLWL